jgi:hypothetical protein
MPKVPKTKYVKKFFGIDGEGRGRKKHRYVLLAACSADNERFHIEDDRGLSSKKCIEFILSLPPRCALFSYAFNYDISKIIEDLPAASIYLLMRPELRQSDSGLIPVLWDLYELNYLGTKFSIKRRGLKNKWVHIWDIWKFYQCKFSKALDDWGVGEKEVVDNIKAMKELRGSFDRVGMKKIREYCFAENRYIATLADKLVTTHDEIGLQLTTFYGPGSTATSLLDKLSIRQKLREPPEAMQHAVASGFFGGRFETSITGPVESKIYSYDISSAYPYQACLLPCLEHGEWRHTNRRADIDKCAAALIRYTLEKPKRKKPWGPFPFRLKDGSVIFPEESDGGWVWDKEFKQAEKMWKNVRFREAWVLHKNCSCRPFDQISQYYLQRIRVGKDVKGIVLKLGYNSCYGKLAQSIGNPKFQSWIWAGIITSGCRAQILNALNHHKNWNNLLMVATDGIYTREKLSLPKPQITHEEKIEKPLGGWEEAIQEKGIFIARPGILFPLNPTIEEIKKVRARGLGRGVLFDNWREILKSWNEHGITKEITSSVVRFIGAKTAIHRVNNGEGYNYFRSRDYGRWVSRDFRLSLHPLPKRESMRKNGTLTLRSFPGLESIPYSKALYDHREPEDVLDLANTADYNLHVEEQPDLDF